MPYELKNCKGGMVVVTKGTNRSHSKKCLPTETAKAQMRALYANEPDAS
jgi:hypothetical protein